MCLEEEKNKIQKNVFSQNRYASKYIKTAPTNGRGLGFIKKPVCTTMSVAHMLDSHGVGLIELLQSHLCHPKHGYKL